MTLWFVFALMTAAAIFAVLWPLGRGGQPRNDASEATVYRDQLVEIDRDLSAGLIGPSEAEAARVEISRRLLAYDTTNFYTWTASTNSRNRLAQRGHNKQGRHNLRQIGLSYVLDADEGISLSIA